jgi:PAS domain S-box-containing protein
MRPGRSSLFWYGAAVLNALLAVGLTHYFEEDLRGTSLLFFALAVAISTLTGGLGPGLFAAVLSHISCDYLWLPPVHALDLNLIGLFRLIALMLLAAGVDVPVRGRRQAEQELRLTLAEMEERVNMRTRQLSEVNAQMMDEIAEREKAEAALRETNKFIKEIINSAGDGMAVMDRQQRFVLWNRAMEEKLGLTPSEVIGRSAQEIFPEMVHLECELLHARALAGETVTGPDIEIPCPGGRNSWWSVTCAPHRNSGGEVIGIIALLHDITARKQAEKRVAESLVREQEARCEAETASRLKDEFLATVSHELRTPLSAIIGWARMLRDGSVREERVPYALDVITRNARMQAQLINDLLDVSRIISGKLLIETTPVELSSVIAGAVSTIRHAAEARSIQLEVQTPAAPQMVSGDADRLQQVVWNLLSNAVKFTPSGGRIAVALENSAQQAQITISDTGQGIAAEFLPCVFDRFSQADNSITRRHGGLGLGLSIVRHLVELHGGSVAVESAGRGQGATFTIRLPRLEGREILPLAQTGAVVALVSAGQTFW